MTQSEPLRQLEAAGYLQYLSEIDIREDGVTVYAKCDPVLVSLLRGDVGRFQCGPWHLLHDDIGPNRVDFRAYKGALGEAYPGSLQIDVSQHGPPPWNLYADVDAFNTQDLVNIAGHLGHDVTWPKLKWFARKVAGVGKVIAWIRKDREDRLSAKG